MGIWDVDGMLAEMTWHQFQGWLAYSEIDPFGEERADLRAGIVATVIANSNRDPRKSKPFTPEDFMPKFGRDTKKPDRRPADARQFADIVRAVKAQAGRTETS